MKYEELKSSLMKYYDCEAEVDYKILKINKFDDELKSALFNFLETGVKPEISVAGWTIDKIMKKAFENEIDAFIHMDMMMKDAEFAEFFGYLGFARK